jgi:hypothetical protein
MLRADVVLEIAEDDQEPEDATQACPAEGTTSWEGGSHGAEHQVPAVPNHNQELQSRSALLKQIIAYGVPARYGQHIAMKTRLAVIEPKGPAVTVEDSEDLEVVVQPKGYAKGRALERPREPWGVWLARKLTGRPEPRASTRMTPMVRKFAEIGRLRFGCPRLNEANRLAVRRFIMSKMDAEADLRTTDAARYIDLAVAAVFVPTTNQCVAAEIAASQTASQLRAVYERLTGGTDAV